MRWLRQCVDTLLAQQPSPQPQPQPQSVAQEMRRVSYGYTDTNLSAEQIARVRESVKRVRELGDTERLEMAA